MGADRLPYLLYEVPAYGCGTWAPFLRYHDVKFYAFIPLPNEGIFYAQAENPAGPRSELKLIKQANDWIGSLPPWESEERNLHHGFAVQYLSLYYDCRRRAF